jgi:DNA invertase Pin-like site-specific DNA recombinase
MNGMMPTPTDKIRSRHRDRLALVYVRQSTLQQVERHQESTRLQYGLVERALELGWPRERVEIIDDDLGRSGTSAEGRPGFQRLVAEVGLGRVGLVLGVEMSRLARSCCDWYQLLEICGLRETLLADRDGVYDVGSFNDRLLLGLKGTMSEAEVHLLKSRMLAGRQAKAQRGEIISLLPRGYIRRPSGEVVLDPDEQVQTTIRLIFDIFSRYGSVNGVLGYLVAHDIQLPCRVRDGAAKGDLEWRRPSRTTLQDMLHNPAYAGAYVYGRHAHKAGAGSPDQWPILLKDRWPAYITWETYERNQEQVTANRNPAAGVARGGPALLAGLVFCGRCGQRMATDYHDQGRFLRYRCSRGAIRFGAPYCQSLAGRQLEALVAELILEALEPASLEVSLQLAEDLELERGQLHRQWCQRLERAHYEVDRARRQYRTVEPENRLVARTLEREWEEALAAEIRVQTDYERFLSRQPLPLSAAERDAIRRLAEDIPTLWQATTTTSADRQAIARLMLDKVVVSVAGESEVGAVECHWSGGVQTQHQLRRTVQRRDQLSGYPALLDRIRDLHSAGHKAPAIAATLNAEGWHPPKRRDTFTDTMVRDLLHHQGVPVGPYPRPSDRVERNNPNEWTMPELAACLEMPANTLYHWLRRGLVRARLAKTEGHSVWLIEADESEIARLRALRKAKSLPPQYQRQIGLERHHDQ